MVHLAPMGYVYDGTVNRIGQKVAAGAYRPPHTTFCGLSVASLATGGPNSVSPTRSPREAFREPVKVALPHDHENACKLCLKMLAGKETDQVQPLLF